MQERGLFEVEASKIYYSNGKGQIYFTCPFCFQHYNTDGNPRKGSKNIEHHHGLRPDEFEKGYVSGRIPHCDDDCFPSDRYRSFKINITDNTQRLE